MMERVGELDGREILVDVRDDGVVEVLFEVGREARRANWLVQFLANEAGVRFAVYLRWMGSQRYAVLAYDEELDRVLVELIELLVAIRLAHPRMVQLELELPEEEGERLQLALEALGV